METLKKITARQILENDKFKNGYDKSKIRDEKSSPNLLFLTSH